MKILWEAPPMKHRISQQLGNTPQKRKQNTLKHYENAKIIRGNAYWGGKKSIIQKKMYSIES